MNDLRSLLTWLAVMAVLSLLEAAARRRRQPGGQKSGKPAPGQRSEVGRPERAEPVTREAEPVGRELRPRPAEVEGLPDEEAALPPVVKRPPPARPAEPPALTTAAEEIRERARRELAAAAAPPVRPAGPVAPVAAGPSVRPAPGRAARNEALRALLRRDPATLRTAVLYREILGPPLGSRPAPGGWEEPGPPTKKS